MLNKSLFFFLKERKILSGIIRKQQKTQELMSTRKILLKNNV